MAQVNFHDDPVTTAGTLPVAGGKAPCFTLVDKTLAEVKLSDFTGKQVVLNIFPSIDTPVCATSTRKFNAEAASRDGVVVLCISVDLPFALGRFCAAEGLESVVPLSAFRNPEFGTDYGVVVTDGAIRGLFSRAVVVVDGAGQVVYSEHVAEITNEPDYDAALAALK